MKIAPPGVCPPFCSMVVPAVHNGWSAGTPGSDRLIFWKIAMAWADLPGHHRILGWEMTKFGWFMIIFGGWWLFLWFSEMPTWPMKNGARPHWRSFSWKKSTRKHWMSWRSAPVPRWGERPRVDVSATSPERQPLILQDPKANLEETLGKITSTKLQGLQLGKIVVHWVWNMWHWYPMLGISSRLGIPQSADHNLPNEQ